MSSTQVNVEGKVVRVHSHRDSCPVPNAVDEVMRLNHQVMRPHAHAFVQGSNMKLPDNSWARVVRCRVCPVRVMVMLSPIETHTWESTPQTGTTIAERAR